MPRSWTEEDLWIYACSIGAATNGREIDLNKVFAWLDSFTPEQWAEFQRLSRGEVREWLRQHCGWTMEEDNKRYAERA